VFLWDEKKMASQCSGNKNKSRISTYSFNEKWVNRYFFINVNNTRVLKCNASKAVSKKCNGEQHFMTMHEDCIIKLSRQE
jgi:hypothetical protein